jgi:hypothetical protein
MTRLPLVGLLLLAPHPPKNADASKITSSDNELLTIYMEATKYNRNSMALFRTLTQRKFAFDVPSSYEERCN